MATPGDILVALELSAFCRIINLFFFVLLDFAFGPLGISVGGILGAIITVGAVQLLFILGLLK